jgi:hypothetical protein
MKTFTLELLEDGDKNSTGYIIKALKEIKKHPKTHGYSKLEVARLFKIETDLKEAIKPYEDAIKSITEIFKNLERVQEKFLEKFDSVISQIQNLSQTGWFLSPDLIRDYYLVELLDLSNNPTQKRIEELLLDKHGKQFEIDKILKSLKKSFPNREQIFNEISKCYEMGLYASVTTLCYTQTDGICNEIWTFGFFDKNPDKSYKTKLYLKLNETDLGFSSHFVTQLGISDNEIIRNSKDSYFSNPKIKETSNNRHLVIHGHSTKFGSQSNALRAILLLNFLEYFVIEFRKKKQ